MRAGAEIKLIKKRCSRTFGWKDFYQNVDRNLISVQKQKQTKSAPVKISKKYFTIYFFIRQFFKIQSITQWFIFTPSKQPF